ncbi:MAG: MFS transporter [Gammaproteobacteria bacterium]|nr:MFS transporter [Gammaproteobacteria bacterium]
MSDPVRARRAERRYQIEVRRNLTRNFVVHLVHGMLGQTGFRLLNAPTFLPAYVLFLSGSDMAVGVALALQALGMTLTPLIGANLIEHRPRVLPMGFVTGGAMRLSVLGIALSGLVLPPDWALVAIFVWLTLFGLFQGMQGVIFNYLMSKVIPVSKRGRLTGLRNFLAGITSAGVALAGGEIFLGDDPGIQGYSYTFVLAFVLTMCGLLSLAFMKEPEPPTLRPRSGLRQRLGEIPGLLRDDPAFTRYVVARSLATMGRMALPFYILFAGSSLALTGTNLGVLTVAFTLAGTVSNLLWGAMADRSGFRLVFLTSIGLWILATLVLVVSSGLAMTALVFVGIGAAVQGFQHASMNLTLEFGHRDDLPVRIAIANSASELAGTIGPLAGGVIAHMLGYPALFVVSVAFLIAGGLMVTMLVPEPRHQPPRG